MVEVPIALLSGLPDTVRRQGTPRLPPTQSPRRLLIVPTQDLGSDRRETPAKTPADRSGDPTTTPAWTTGTASTEFTLVSRLPRNRLLPPFVDPLFLHPARGHRSSGAGESRRETRGEKPPSSIPTSLHHSGNVSPPESGCSPIGSVDAGTPTGGRPPELGPEQLQVRRFPETAANGTRRC